MTLTPELIIKTVSDYFQQPIENVISGSQKKEYVMCRHFSMYFIKMVFFNNLSLQQVGSYFHGRGKSKDHATILHAIKAVNNQKFRNRLFTNDFEILMKKIKKIEDKKPGSFSIAINLKYYYFKNRVFTVSECAKEVKRTVKYKEPLYINIASANNREYSGYREHQL